MSVMEQELVRTRRSFTDEFKRDAVALVVDEGNKIVDVARGGPPPDRPPRIGGRHVSDGATASEDAAQLHRRVQV
jgi:hypothetical protein